MMTALSNDLTNSFPIEIAGGRLYGAFFCDSGDVLLFNTEYVPMFRWNAATGRVHGFTAGRAAPIDGIRKVELYWDSAVSAYPYKWLARSLGEWVIAAGLGRPVRCPRLPRPVAIQQKQPT